MRIILNKPDRSFWRCGVQVWTMHQGAFHTVVAPVAAQYGAYKAI